MTASCHPISVSSSGPGSSPRLLTLLLLLLLLLVTPGVLAAGRVLFPGSDIRSEVRSGVRSVIRSSVRPGPGGSEAAFWLWRGSTKGQPERPHLLPDPSRRPLQSLRQPSRPPQQLNPRPVHRQNVQLLETRPTVPRRPPVAPDRRPVPARLVVDDDQLAPRILRPQSVPVISVPPVPSVTLEGLSLAPNAAVVRTAGSETPPSATALRSIGPAADAAHPQPVPSRLQLQLDDPVSQMLSSVSQLTSSADSHRIGAGLEVTWASSSAATSPGGAGGRRRGGEGGRRRPTVMSTNGDSGGSSSPTVITDAAPVTSQTVTSQTDAISVTSPTLTIDSGSQPVYYNNDVIGGSTVLERDDEGPRESRQLEPPRDVTNTVRVLIAIASLKGGDQPRHVNEVQDTKPDLGHLVVEQHSCPRLGGNITLECRVEAAKGRGSVQKFWWGKRHFDYDDGRVRDELIAVDGRPFNGDKIRVQTVGEGVCSETAGVGADSCGRRPVPVQAGQQAGYSRCQVLSGGRGSPPRLLVSELTAADAGLYLCQVSRQGTLLSTQVTVVLCRR